MKLFDFIMNLVYYLGILSLLVWEIFLLFKNFIILILTTQNYWILYIVLFFSISCVYFLFKNIKNKIIENNNSRNKDI